MVEQTTYSDLYIKLRKSVGKRKIPNYKYLGLNTLYDFSHWCNENHYYWCNKVLSVNLGAESIRTCWLLFWMDTKENLRWNCNINKWFKIEDE